MAKEKQPRSPAAKRTVKKKNETVNPNVPITEEPTTMSARNAVIQGNSAPDSDEIRRRAYELYEQAGRPEGQQDEFWYRAEQEFHNRQSKKSA